ncbi:MAG: hypothetical protein LBP53_08805 [Candidatus Peribacteria bacterium]|jgi:hypothetical protein|nr:hypothetical protein [Candidatus Peribacteria bacterium]
MKKLNATLVMLGVTMLGFGIVPHYCGAAVLEDAVQWGYDKGLTSFSITNSFRAYDTLRRDEAAKFFVEFARVNGNMNYSYGNNCSFYDLNAARSDLKTYVTDACSYGFLKGNGNYIYPSQNLTNAQSITVVVRMIDGYQSES